MNVTQGTFKYTVAHAFGYQLTKKLHLASTKRTAMTTAFKSRLAFVITLLVALMMIASGAGKLTLSNEVIQSFENWQLPRWLIVPVALTELIAGILLFIPKLRNYAAAAIILVMGGAIATHLRVNEYVQLLMPLMLIAAVVVSSIFRYQVALEKANDLKANP